MATTTLHCHRSRLVQRTVSSPADADRAFANVTINSREGERSRGYTLNSWYFQHVLQPLWHIAYCSKFTHFVPCFSFPSRVGFTEIPIILVSPSMKSILILHIRFTPWCMVTIVILHPPIAYVICPSPHLHACLLVRSHDLASLFALRSIYLRVHWWCGRSGKYKVHPDKGAVLFSK